MWPQVWCSLAAGWLPLVAAVVTHPGEKAGKNLQIPLGFVFFIFFFERVTLEMLHWTFEGQVQILLGFLFSKTPNKKVRFLPFALTVRKM